MTNGKFIAIFIFIIACQSVIGQDSSKSSKSSEVDRIDSYLQEIIAREQIVGMTIAVTQNDAVIYAREFGYRNIETRDTMRLNCIFHWASVSKTFVGTAVMQLVERGKIDLDEKLTTYLPYFKLKDPDYPKGIPWDTKITIRQMLNHTSGIGDVRDYEWDKPQYDDAAAERYVRSMTNDKMKFEPGMGWAYSNTAYNILGVVISEVSGMSFEIFVKRNILDPLRMTYTSFLYPEIPESLRVKGHVTDRNKPVLSNVYPYNRIHAPSSTLNSNVMEMTHYAMANLHRGVHDDVRILSDQSYDVLWTNSVNLTDEPAMGVSWFLGEHNGLKTASHSGGDTGFNSLLLLVPEKNISVMLVCNYGLQNISPAEIGYKVLDILLSADLD